MLGTCREDGQHWVEIKRQLVAARQSTSPTHAGQSVTFVEVSPPDFPVEQLLPSFAILVVKVQLVCQNCERLLCEQCPEVLCVFNCAIRYAVRNKRSSKYVVMS